MKEYHNQWPIINGLHWSTKLFGMYKTSKIRMSGLNPAPNYLVHRLRVRIRNMRIERKSNNNA